jgi:formylglycine-generating enzyme required for sulfatase activity
LGRITAVRIPSEGRRASCVAATVAAVLAAALPVGCAGGPRHDVALGATDSGPAPAPLAAFEQPLEYTTIAFRMVPISGGSVTLETPNGPKTVEVGPFWMSPTEITWDIYDVFALRLDRHRLEHGLPSDAVTRPSKPYLPPDRGFGHAGYPAISISHHAAEAFCEWLSIKTGRTYRLPTEAEWTLACRTGGINGDNIDQRAWHDGNADFQTQPVAKKKPDANGLYDLCGNAAEWVNGPDGEAITMGGSFNDLPDDLGCTARVPAQESWNESDPQIPKGKWWLADAGWVGFRIVCVPDERSEGDGDAE